MWERFFNWQSDMDWAWGPLLALRPPRDTPLRPWLWARLFVVFTGLGLLLIALAALLCFLLPRFAAAERLTLPPLAAETVATLRAMALDPDTQALLAGIGLSLPPLFFLACLPFHWAWNRRAARLKSSPAVEAAPEDTGQWPPPVRRAENMQK